MEEKTVDIPCNCFAHMLRLAWTPGEPTIDLAAWAWRGSQPGWRHRWRMIMRIVRVGYPYADDLTLTYEEATRLSEAIEVFRADRRWILEDPEPSLTP